MVRGARPARPARQPERLPVNAQLYVLCRSGTDPAITRALEEAADPLSKVKKAIAAGIDWGMVDDITNALQGARQES